MDKNCNNSKNKTKNQKKQNKTDFPAIQCIEKLEILLPISAK